MCHLWEWSLTDEKVDGHISVREMLIPHTIVVTVFFGGRARISGSVCGLHHMTPPQQERSKLCSEIKSMEKFLLLSSPVE